MKSRTPTTRSSIGFAPVSYTHLQVRLGSLIGGKPGVLHMHTGKGKGGLQDVMAVVEESNVPIKHFRPTHVANCF